MEMIKIGKIVNAVGLKGEVKVYCYTDKKERFEEIDRIYAGEESYKIENVRYQGNVVVLRLEGVSGRDAAEARKGKDVFIPESYLKELPEGTYYVRELQGVRVVDEQGSRLGSLADVIQNSAQDLYEIKMENGKKILLPAVKAFVLDIDMKTRTVKVKLPEGLLEL